ncbi:MAG: hypothetical protein ACI9MN_001347, partial [Saprospiraceae bacterium]
EKGLSMGRLWTSDEMSLSEFGRIVINIY